MKKLIPIEQKEITFQGDKITAVLVQDIDGRENIYIPLKPLVESLGLSWNGQRERIKRNPVLDKVCRSARVTRVEQNRTRSFKMLSIPISHLNGLLFGIDTNRVKPDIRPLLIEYQEKCYQILFEAFNGIESMTRFYQSIGHDEKWIDKRIYKHVSSTELNDVWLLHGVPIEKHDQLRDIINQGTFGLTAAEHKQLKNIPPETSLPDNMSRTELLISSFADEVAIALSDRDKPKTYDENETIAKSAGQSGKSMLDEFETKTGQKVLSPKNNLEKKKRPLIKTGKDK